MSLLCLNSKYHLRNDMKQSKLILRQMYVFQNHLLGPLQFRQWCQKLLHWQTHAELFCDILLHGKRAQSPIPIVWFCSLGLNFICC